jgi:hypothetical protein
MTPRDYTRIAAAIAPIKRQPWMTDDVWEGVRYARDSIVTNLVAALEREPEFGAAGFRDLAQSDGGLSGGA